MTLLEKLGAELPTRYYLGVDVGYREHVAVAVSLQTFVRGDDRWKRARCVHFPNPHFAGFQLQTLLLNCDDPTDRFLHREAMLLRVLSPGQRLQREPIS